MTFMKQDRSLHAHHSLAALGTAGEAQARRGDRCGLISCSIGKWGKIDSMNQCLRLSELHICIWSLWCFWCLMVSRKFAAFSNRWIVSNFEAAALCFTESYSPLALGVLGLLWQMSGVRCVTDVSDWHCNVSTIILHQVVTNHYLLVPSHPFPLIFHSPGNHGGCRGWNRIFGIIHWGCT